MDKKKKEKTSKILSTMDKLSKIFIDKILMTRMFFPFSFYPFKTMKIFFRIFFL
jgi:hypothetical protein